MCRGDCWSCVSCSHVKKPCPTLDSQKEPWTHLETCRNQGWIQPGFSSSVVATANPCCSCAQLVSPLCTAPTQQPCSTSLSAPQDSALGVAKLFKEAELNMIQISWADTSSAASIAMADPKPRGDAPGDRDGADGIPYSEPRVSAVPLCPFTLWCLKCNSANTWNTCL